jgi:hypothetical protein
MRPRVWVALAVALAAAGLSSGCVTRRIMITSDPPGAQVFRDGQPLGPTPVEQPFVYYGKYRYTLVKDGYAPLVVEPELCPPWYEFPGLDLISENLLPFTLRDVQAFHYELTPLVPVSVADLKASSDALRARGKSIGPATPTPRRPRNQTLPPPTPANVLPAPANSANAPGNPASAPDNTNAPDNANAPDKVTTPADAPAVNAAKKKPLGSAGFQGIPVSRPEPDAGPTSPASPSR